MDKFLIYCENHDENKEVIKKNIMRIYKLYEINSLGDLLIHIYELENLIETVLDKYTLKTAVSVMETIKYIALYHGYDNSFLYRFTDELNNLIDLRDNKVLYSKFCIFEVKRIMEEKSLYYLQNHTCFTFLRNFIVFYCMLNELPLRLSQWTKIKYVRSDYECLEDFDDYPYYLVSHNGVFYFIINKIVENEFKGQIIHKIQNKITHKLLTRLIFSLGIKSNYFICNKSGKEITNTNLANGITSFSKSIFGKSVSINGLRCQLKVYAEPLQLSKTKKIILEL